MELPKTKKTTKEEKVNTISKTSGIPMTEEDYKEWQKAFTFTIRKLSTVGKH